MEINKLIDNAKDGEITAYINSLNVDSSIIMPNYNNEDKKVYDYFNNICSKQKLLKALLVLDINENILDKNFSELSVSIKNKLAIIESLVSNKNVFIYKNIHKGLIYREIQNIKRIFKKFIEHNKKVIIITDDIEFLFGLTKNVYIVENEKIINLSPIDWFNDELYKYVSKPPIIDFVMNCKSRGIKIDNCYETKELLKAIYRSVQK